MSVVPIVDTSTLATAALQGTGNTSAATVATNTGTIAGAVGAHDAALPAGVVEIAGIGQDTAPIAVMTGRAVRAWMLRTGARVAVLLGVDGATIASASNRVPCSLGSAVTTGGAAGTSANLSAGSNYAGSPLAYAPKIDSSGIQYVAATSGNGAGLALDATLTGGTQVAIVKGAAVTGAAVSGAPVYVAGIDGGGLVRPLLTSAAGNAQVSTAKGTSYSSAALEISRVVSASACSPSKVRVQNISGSTRYVHMFNASSLPANGTVPTMMFTLTANSGGEVVFQIPTERFSTGLVVASSSSQGSLTIAASAEFLIWVDLFPPNV